jgi:cellulose biosynthesis protein BcsQ
MRIKLALLDFDKNYVQRFYDTINRAYSNKLEIHAFTNENSLLIFLKDNKIDILLINENVNLNIEHDSKLIVIKLAEKHALENELSTNESSLNNFIYKYQRISLVYKEILNVYSKVYKAFDEKKHYFYDLQDSTMQEFNVLNNTTIISFMSQGLGSGTSTIASSLALRLAENNMKTLFLDLQSFATINSIFNAEGKFSMSEIIYAIKSNKDNMAIILETSLKMDSSGVFFYDSCPNPFEINELKAEELIKLLSCFSEIGAYKYIIIDINYMLNELCFSLLKYSNKVFFVTEAREEHQIRLNKILKSISIKEKRDNQEYMTKLGIVCNKYINNFGDDIHYEELEFACYIPKYNDVNTKSIAKEIAKTSILDTLISSERRAQCEL